MFGNYKTLDELIENKELAILEKKSAMKKADSIVIPLSIGKIEITEEKTSINKAEIGTFKQEDSEAAGKEYVDVLVVINTTNIMDSHDDVHMPGIWNKSLKENKSRIVHLMEHEMRFDNLISKGKDINAFVRNLDWKELGFDYDGKTQALMFKSRVWKWRNEKAYNLYTKGEITEHSVGMRYVKLDIAANNPKWEEEFKLWEKYIDKVVNKEQVEEQGWFWVVTEAKVIEGSAVVLGSNAITPTQETNQSEEKQEIIEPQKTETPKPSFDTLAFEKALNKKLERIIQ